MVANWQRVKAGNVLKNFGFCRYANAEGAMRAMRLLNGVRVGDDELHVWDYELDYINLDMQLN